MSCLRLGQTSLILTKTSPQSQIGIQYASVALISSGYVQRENTPFLVVPLMCLTIRDKQSLHELTAHSEKVMAEIRKHTRLAQFSTMEKLTDYLLNEIPLHGTHIFVTDLKTSEQGNRKPIELKGHGNDICINTPHLYNAKTTTSNLVLVQPWLIENSLRQFFRYMFLRHPKFLRFSINGHHDPEDLNNPFNKLMLADNRRQSTGAKADGESWFNQIKTSEFALQTLTTSFMDKLHQIRGSVGSGPFERTMLE